MRWLASFSSWRPQAGICSKVRRRGEGVRFEGTTAVVTGAAHGIGEATAHRLADEGATVICVDVHERGRAVAEAIVADGGSAVFRRGDIGVGEDIKEVVAFAVAQHDGIDV